jgi:hypothetical protein
MLLGRLLLLVGAALSGAAGQSQMRCPADSRADDLAALFIVSGGNVRMPIGALLLVRKKGQLGAIHLTSIDPGSAESFGKSTYESFFQSDGSASFVAKNVVRRVGELNVQRSKGPGRGIYIYRPGPYKAQIGNWTFAFNTPDMMAMSDASFWTGVGDHGYEFAPPLHARWPR